MSWNITYSFQGIFKIVVINNPSSDQKLTLDSSSSYRRWDIDITWFNLAIFGVT